jgi:hypothetical protein
LRPYFIRKNPATADTSDEVNFMLACPRCRQPHSAEATTCSHCGAPLAVTDPAAQEEVQAEVNVEKIKYALETLQEAINEREQERTPRSPKMVISFGLTVFLVLIGSFGAFLRLNAESRMAQEPSSEMNAELEEADASATALSYASLRWRANALTEAVEIDGGSASVWLMDATSGARCLVNLSRKTRSSAWKVVSLTEL